MERPLTGAGTDEGAPFLLCDVTGETGTTFPDEARVSTPLQCLHRAVDRNPGLIVLFLGHLPFRDREALVELITVLKHNRHTHTCPVLALVPAKHRKLFEQLNDAGADFVRCVGEIRLAPEQILEILEQLGPEDRPDRHLASMCPFLHYEWMDAHHELTVCGAYLDRLVLGGRKLHERCERETHLHCEYYLKPRRES